MRKNLFFLFIFTCFWGYLAGAQCPPTTAVKEVVDASCSGGCRINLYNWPDGATVYVFNQSAAPATLVASASMNGTFGDGFLNSDSVCVPCNIILSATSAVPAHAGCLIFADPVLAVVLNNFTVLSFAESNILNWGVNSEQQGVTYILQRSTDSKSFIDIAAIKGTGYGDFEKSYSYTDPDPPQGYIYYRLKAIESNGSITYSQIQSAGSITTTSATIFPNPVTGNSFNINIPVDLLPAEIIISNTLGQIVYSGQVTIPTSTIPASFSNGIYALKITGNNNTSTVVKLIKQ